MPYNKGHIHLGALSSLVYDLCRGKETGVLRIDGPSGLWEAGLCQGRLTALSVPIAYTDPLLGHLLLRKGAIDPSCLTQALREARLKGSLYGQVLISQGLSNQVLWAALKTQSHERFSNFLKHASGFFLFKKGVRLEIRKGLGHPLNPLKDFGLHRAASSKRVFHPSGKGLSSIPPNKDPAFEQTLKKWWRSMAKKYHPDSHAQTDPSTRVQFTRRFMEAREIYKRCLETGQLPGGMGLQSLIK